MGLCKKQRLKIRYNLIVLIKLSCAKNIKPHTQAEFTNLQPKSLCKSVNKRPVSSRRLAFFKPKKMKRAGMEEIG
jgi:hypothetical protein